MCLILKILISKKIKSFIKKQKKERNRMIGSLMYYKNITNDRIAHVFFIIHDRKRDFFIYL